MKYTEIFKLKKMLENAHIPFKFREIKMFQGFQILYPSFGKLCVCSVIQHCYSYGNEKDLLERKGLMTPEEVEQTQDDVLGNLGACNVFDRIKQHFYTQPRGA